MKYCIIILLSFLVFSCDNTKQITEKTNKIDQLFKKKIEHSLISRGDNFPDFNYSKDSMDFFLVALHENIPNSDFKKKTKLNAEKINEIEKLLESKNWLHFVKEKPKPSVFIATKKDGEFLFKKSILIANDIVSEIQKELPEIKQKFSTTEISKKQNFKKWSFLILSDVLLDSWQIDNVEREFLKKEKRPERNGKNYYYSIMENIDGKRETFGIYGNQYEEKNGMLFSVYGNNRIGMLLKSSENIVTKSDNKIFIELANDFKPKLITILNKNKKYINEIYKESGYKEEISFEEFFIWWYHFIYTESTNIMNDKGMLKIPESGNFEYQIIE